MKKKATNQPKHQTNEIKHYLGVLSEDFQSKIQVIGEQYFDIKKTLDSHGKTLDSHTEMIGNLMTDMEIVKSDLETIKFDLKKKVDYDDFAKLEKRVAHLEARR